METWDAIRSRRSVRVLSDRAIADADLGIGSGHAAVDDHALARTILGHPDNRFCIALMSLGYPLERPLAPLQRPDRRPFDEVVHPGRW